MRIQESWNHAVSFPCPHAISLSWKEEFSFNYYIQWFDHNSAFSVMAFTKRSSFQLWSNHAKYVWQCLLWVRHVLKAWSPWLMTAIHDDRLLTPPLLCVFAQITVNLSLIPSYFRIVWWFSVVWLPVLCEIYVQHQLTHHTQRKLKEFWTTIQDSTQY